MSEIKPRFASAPNTPKDLDQFAAPRSRAAKSRNVRAARKSIQQSPAGGGPKSRRQRFGEARNRIAAKTKLIKTQKALPFVVASSPEKNNKRSAFGQNQSTQRRPSGGSIYPQVLQLGRPVSRQPATGHEHPARSPTTTGSWTSSICILPLSQPQTHRGGLKDRTRTGRSRSLCVEERGDSGTAGLPTARERGLRVAGRDGRAWEGSGSLGFGSRAGEWSGS
jgi:hypothetical protein